MDRKCYDKIIIVEEYTGEIITKNNENILQTIKTIKNEYKDELGRKRIQTTRIVRIIAKQGNLFD